MLHELGGQAHLVSTLQLGQLHRAVDASHLHFVVNFVAHHTHAIGHGEFHDIGQVVLTLGVFVVQPGQPVFEMRCRHGHDAAVDLLDLFLRIACIFLLDDGLHFGAVAHDAAITCRVGKLQRQQGQLVATAGGDQIFERVGLG